MAVFGVVSNLSFCYKVLKKAGVNRKKGIRPTVRGVIKNPCDHPHGGGEGKGSPPVAQVSP
jgi:large subunit ribosomal protein L2